MSSNRRRERLRVHKALQDAADRLTAHIPDCIQIGVSAEEILFDCITWSSALTRHHFSGETERRMLCPSGWKACAEDEVMHLFGEAIEDLKDRWDSAGALGLVRGGELIDLAPGNMMIDRTLLGMLETKGNDMGDAVRQMVDRRSRRVLVPHSMNVPVDTEQQVRSHVAVQEQQRMGG